MPLSEAAITSLGSIGSSLIGSIGNGFVNSILSGHSALKQAQYQMLLQNHQYKLQRKLNQHAYLDTTNSMREAGINPMLAISNGANSGSAVGGQASVSTPQIDLDLQGAYATAKQLKNEAKRVENETEMTKSNAKRNDYESDVLHEQSVELNNKNRAWDSYGESLYRQGLEQDVENKRLEGLSFISNTAKNYQDIANSVKSTEAYIRNLYSGAYHSDSQTKYIDAQTKSLDAQLEWMKKHPLLYGLSQGAAGLGAVNTAVGIGAGTVVGAYNAHQKNKANSAKAIKRKTRR